MPNRRKPRKQYICDNCGKPFERTQRARESVLHFCSVACRNCNGARIRPIIAHCKTCGQELRALPYELNKDLKQYCSRRCANARGQSVPITKVCVGCHTEFTVSFSERRRTYCSRECFLNRRKHQLKTCPQCGKQFAGKTSKKRKGVDQKFCSPECQGLARRNRTTINCQHCGRPFEIGKFLVGRRRYCSRRCQMLSAWSSQEEQEVIAQLSELLHEAPLQQYTFPWLVNPNTQRHLYVDAYFQRCNLAVEYDGKQHREHMRFYHNDPTVFLASQTRDKIKETLLEEHGIPLLRIQDNEPRTIAHLEERLNLTFS